MPSSRRKGAGWPQHSQRPATCYNTQSTTARSRTTCSKDWDEKRGRAKAKRSTYLDDINQVLNRYQDAATAAAHAAQLAGRVIDKDKHCYVRLAQESKAIIVTRILGSRLLRYSLICPQPVQLPHQPLPY